MNHKRFRPKNRRSGCLRCKPWKVNGFATERVGGEKYSDHVRRVQADPVDALQKLLEEVGMREDVIDEPYG